MSKLNPLKSPSIDVETQGVEDGTSEARSSEVVVRQGTRDDWPLLNKVFTTHYCSDPRAYYSYRTPPHTLVAKLETLLKSPNWKLLVACPDFEPTEILGELLYRPALNKRPPAVAWIFTTHRWQGKGVAKALFKIAEITPGFLDCAFLLPHVSKWAKELGFRCQFRPYLPDNELWNEVNK